MHMASPSTRRLDIVVKRALYERIGVREYWFVDLDVDRVEVHRLTDGVYGAPELVGLDGVLSPPHLPGLDVAVADASARSAPRRSPVRTATMSARPSSWARGGQPPSGGEGAVRDIKRQSPR
jgi:hypothetical protein